MSRGPSETSISDEELACRARYGCVESFERLLRKFQVPVLQFLRRQGPSADADDVAQETFLRAYENLHRYDRRWRFSAWLFTIARRTSINYRRRTRPTADAAAVEAAPARDAEPLEALIAAEGRRRLWDAAARVLSEEQLTALWLCYVEDMSTAEIALALGRSRTSVKVMLFRARRKLRPLLVAADGQRRLTETVSSG
jgi:RNA polymerase sigma-70 factor, ECF subfamily